MLSSKGSQSNKRILGENNNKMGIVMSNVLVGRQASHANMRFIKRGGEFTYHMVVWTEERSPAINA